MAPRRCAPALAALCSAALLLVSTSGFAAGRYDSRLRFRVLRTPHFTIYFHQGEAPLAARLAGIAERVRTDLAARTGIPAPAHSHVVLVDQSDVANGWSTPVPYNLIEVAAIPPPPSSFLGHHDDWLRIVFTHEYAHIFHLDRVGGVMRGLRWLMGRSPATFPNLFVPQWQVEGFATWAESALTGFGRVQAADVRGVVASVSASGRATIDRAGGGMVAWPSGHTPYFQGGVFDQAIAERSSTEALGELTRETARRLPFFGGPAHRKVLGTSAADLWESVFVTPDRREAASAAGARRLTREGFAVSGPRVVRRRAPAGGESEEVYYSTQGPHRFPDVRMVNLAGGTAAHVASRYDGQALTSDGRWLFYDQLEFDGAVAIVSDLYARDLESGRTRRLSRGERLTDPDIDPTGTRLAAVRARDGGKQITIWRVSRTTDGAPVLAAGPERVAGAEECQYASPRWSPDGTAIVAVRHCIGTLPIIVEVPADGGTERVLAAGGRNLTPVWSRDGGSVLFASDRADGRFKLYAVRRVASAPTVEVPELALDAPGGVMWPDVAADGRTVVFISLTADGYDVFADRLTDGGDPPSGAQMLAAASTPEPGAALAQPPGDATAAGEPPLPAAREYSPWRTLLPRNWTPLLNVDSDKVDVGATTGATDVLGYHAYNVSVMWRASGQGADFTFDAPAVDWSASYSYNRWQPSLLLSAWSGLDTILVAEEDSSRTLVSQERSQGIFAGFVIPWRRVRVAQSWLGGMEFDERRLPASTGVADRSRNGFRAGWALTSARQYGYSISPEHGTWAAVNLERVTPGLGADGNASSLTVDWRAYLPGLGRHHVAAVRVGAASSTGDSGMKRVFDLGGSAVPRSPFALGQRVVGLLRGLPSDERQGTAALVGNIDYRFPLSRVERGIRTWPIFLRDIHGAVFADVGSAGDAIDALPSAAWSVGGELATTITLGYTWHVSLAAGAAWVRDPSRAGERDRVAAFVRTGYAF